MNGTATIAVGNAVHWAQEYDGEPFHALFCDPPYHLTSIVKRFGTGSRNNTAPAVFQRAQAGFMGQQWDGGDVAFRPETWAAFLNVLHPGAFGLAFCGSRGWHRQAVAIEDAGFILHPTIYLMSFSTGFPKATRIDTQIDRDAKAEREVIGEQKLTGTARIKGMIGTAPSSAHDGYETRELRSTSPLTAPATPLAKAWAGHRYGLQALAPACEPLLLFQRPYAGRTVDCLTRTGAGGLNIDAARINGPDTEDARWPKNLVLMDREAEEALDAQREGASGLFYAVERQLREACPVKYIAKPGKHEKDAGLHGMPVQRCPSFEGDTRPCRSDGSSVINGSSAQPLRRNVHPTVKAVEACRYFSSLLLPPAEYAPRRLFVPFSGSGSEIIGALLAGWECVQGVELSDEYASIARARCEHWAAKSFEATDSNGQMSLFEENDR